MDRVRAQALARELVSRMTAEEMASQLRYDAPGIPHLGIPAYNWWCEALHGIARAGTATVFPQAIGMAATFDPQFLGEVARVIATEGRAKYNEASALDDRNIYKGLTFWSPNINIFRDPRWGRGHETYGEDPYLTSRMGVAFVKGLQGDGEYLNAAACAKHYAVHSGPESLRHEFNAVVNEKDLWETYLPAFEALVREAEVEAVMGAYNRVNGEPACGSPTLLVDILRGKWGFKGHVVSDCWAIKDFHEAHHVTDTAPESAALAIRNGCDLNCGNTYLHLLAALREGLITEDDLKQAAERLMTTRIMLGILGGAKTPWDNLTLMDVDTPEHDELSYLAACRSMTLLKNDGILPLKGDTLRTVAVIGPNADSQAALEGNYTGKSSRYTTFLEGIRQAFEGKARVLYALGSQLFRDSDSSITEKDNRLSEALAIAAHADVIILCVGLDATLEGEQGDTGNAFVAGDKRDLELPPPQARLLEAMKNTGTPLVTVLACGSALRVEDGNAVLWTGYPGQAGGRAMADILLGKVSPSGKLPVTFYRGVQDLPEFTDYAMTNRTYRYFGGEPLYPFGYGLAYSAVKLNNAVYGGGAVTVDAENTGAMEAEEVIQVYIRNDHHDAPPNPVLCAFQRVRLAAGERRSVRLLLSPTAFTVVGDDGERREHAGPRTLYVGTSQPDSRSSELTGQQCLAIRLV